MPDKKNLLKMSAVVGSKELWPEEIVNLRAVKHIIVNAPGTKVGPGLPNSGLEKKKAPVGDHIFLFVYEG